MKNTKEHTSKKQRIFRGEGLAFGALNWLNSHSGRRHDFRQLIEKIQEYEITFKPSPDSFMRHPKRETDRKLQRIEREVTAILRKYPLVRHFSLEPITPGEAPRAVMHEVAFGQEATSATVLMSIHWLTNLGLVNRLRQCQCKKWFFARFERQHACSASCRRRKYESTEKFLEERRKYAREYYRLKVSGIVK